MKRLVVLVAGINTKTKSWHSLLTQFKQENELADSDWLVWDHQQSLLSFGSGWSLSRELKAKIEEQWYLNGSYDDIILIGHSFGGILVRQAYLLAAGIYSNHPDVSPWHEKVSRFVLFAAINRGFNPANSLITAVGVKLIKATPLFRFLLFRDSLKGSAFITNLRISWIRYFSNLNNQPTVVQLLGTRDSIVNRDDSIDLEQFPNAFHIDVPEAKHGDIYRFDRAKNREGKYQLIRKAILSDNPPSVPKKEVSKKNPVVFVLHGIRDSNSGWVEQIRSKIIDREPNAEVITASYGYFSAFNFFWPGRRKRNIEWFQDKYSYYFSRYPDADFHFIGHSNGTYILGESLKKVSSMRFKRVYLAGSVLPRDYPWIKRFDYDCQLENLRNDRSSWDWPVGILCSGLRGIGMRDIGTGGFDGFNWDEERTQEVFYYKGDHGKPLKEGNLDNIIDYILTGKGAPPPGSLIPEKEVSFVFRWCSRLAPFVMQGLLALLLSMIYFIIQSNAHDFSWEKLAPPLVACLIAWIVLETV
jgi:pimeloyl-ACP methyl ester carboxylesterase